ncbi:hypothetical protein [Paenibacillus barengoltzii]|uniref:hypothetical protein n=1 Tax=Paenibacillus barengoltzii TaxID=343517 RepID=UPI002FDA3231
MPCWLPEITIDRTEIDFVARFFSQLGTEAKVLQPQEVTDRIRDYSRKLLEHYTT